MLPNKNKVLRNATVLLCEGYTDSALLRELTTHYQTTSVDLVSPDWITGNMASGRSGFASALRAIRTTIGFRSVKRVVIISDADANPAQSFQEVCAQIAQAKTVGGPPGEVEFPVPSSPMTVASNADIELVVIMVPLNGQPGSLESVMYEVIGDIDANRAALIDGLAQATGVTSWQPQKQGKMKVRTYIACSHQSNPDISLGHLWTRGGNAGANLIPVSHRIFRGFASTLQSFIV